MCPCPVPSTWRVLSSHSQTHLSGPRLGPPSGNPSECAVFRVCVPQLGLHLSVGLFMITVDRQSPPGVRGSLGTGLSLIHLWGPRDAPRAHRQQAPGACAWMEALHRIPNLLCYVHLVQFRGYRASPACFWEMTSAEDSVCLCCASLCAYSCWSSHPSLGGGGVCLAPCSSSWALKL